MDFLSMDAALAHLDSCTRHVVVAPLPDANPADVRGTILIDTNVPALSARTWTAVCTTKALNTWFAPVTGDFRRGGTYYVDNLSWGTIFELVPERRFSATWNFDDRTTILNVDLTPPAEPELQDTSTLISVSHGSDLRTYDWERYGVLAVGAAWDTILFKLSAFLSFPRSVPLSEIAPQMQEWTEGPVAGTLMYKSLLRWRDATVEYGVDEDLATSMLERALEVLQAE